MDLSQLSNDQLMQMYQAQKLGGQPAPQSLQDLSNDQLMQLYQQKGPATIQEMHPAFTLSDRLIAKNLATSPEVAANYLKEKHPELDVQIDPQTKEIKAKGQNEMAYRVLDPDTGIWNAGLKENLMDLGDIASDVIQGVGTGAATAAGGVVGAGAGGVGALPGAALAGGIAGSELEGARQLLGSALGLKDNLSGKDIAIQGAAGALSPLLLGTGASAANVTGKGLAGRIAGAIAPEAIVNAGDKAALQTALSAQRGIPGRLISSGIEKIAPSVGGWLSGTGPQAVKDLASNAEVVSALEKDPTALESFVENAFKENSDKMNEASKSAWNDYASHVEKALGDKKVDVSAAADSMWSHVRDAQKEYAARPSGANEQALTDAYNAFTEVWGKPKINTAQELVKDAYKIAPSELQGLSKDIQGVANYSRRFGIGAKPPTADLVERMGDAANSSLKKIVNEAAPGAQDLKTKLAQAIEDKKWFYKNLNPDKILGKSLTASREGIKATDLANSIKAMDARYGTNLDAVRGTLNALDTFNKSGSGLFSAKRIPASLLGGTIGYTVTRGTEGDHSGFGGLPIPGYLVGAGLGGALGGPAMLRRIIDMTARNGGGAISSMIPTATQSVWNMMR